MKVGGDQVLLAPWLSIFGGDASHGSHMVVAPMTECNVCYCEVLLILWTLSCSFIDKIYIEQLTYYRPSMDWSINLHIMYVLALLGGEGELES